MFDSILNTPWLLRDQYEQTMQQIYDRQKILHQWLKHVTLQRLNGMLTSRYGVKGKNSLAKMLYLRNSKLSFWKSIFGKWHIVFILADSVSGLRQGLTEMSALQGFWFY